MALLAIIAAALLFIKLIATPPTWLSVLSHHHCGAQQTKGVDRLAPPTV